MHSVDGNAMMETVKPNLKAMGILMFPSKSARNKNDSDPIHGEHNSHIR